MTADGVPGAVHAGSVTFAGSLCGGASHHLTAEETGSAVDVCPKSPHGEVARLGLSPVSDPRSPSFLNKRTPHCPKAKHGRGTAGKGFWKPA